MIYCKGRNRNLCDVDVDFVVKALGEKKHLFAFVSVRLLYDAHRSRCGIGRKVIVVYYRNLAPTTDFHQPRRLRLGYETGVDLVITPRTEEPDTHLEV